MNENESKNEIKIPDDFGFPYEKPYDIQINFMKDFPIKNKIYNLKFS